MLEIPNKQRKSTWKDEYRIGSYDVDFRNEIPIFNLCKFLQETAYHHAENLGFGRSQLLENNQYWILSRLLLKVLKYPRMGDIIQVETWASGIDGLFALRDYSIFCNDECIGSAISAWIILNAETKRPIRPTADFNFFIPENKKRAIDAKLEKIPALNNSESECSLKTVYSDLDVNKHTNNAKYVEWVLNHYPFEIIEQNNPSELEINFLSETFAGNTIKIQTQKTEKSQYLHCLLREDDNKEICRLRIVWK